MRKKKILVRSVFYTIMICAIAFMTGCTEEGRHGGTIDEPEITVDYLSDEYADQLIRDGATCILGTMEIATAEDGTVTLTIDAKQYVEDAGKPNGYYIADRNMEYLYPLASEARATFLSGGTSIAKVMTADEFVTAAAQDLEKYGKNNPEYQKYKLYDIYVMNDQVELLIARYLP